jgi:hypothetical protein
VLSLFGVYQTVKQARVRVAPAHSNKLVGAAE